MSFYRSVVLAFRLIQNYADPLAHGKGGHTDVGDRAPHLLAGQLDALANFQIPFGHIGSFGVLPSLCLRESCCCCCFHCERNTALMSSWVSLFSHAFTGRLPDRTTITLSVVRRNAVSLFYRCCALKWGLLSFYSKLEIIVYILNTFLCNHKNVTLAIEKKSTF